MESSAESVGQRQNRIIRFIILANAQAPLDMCIQTGKFLPASVRTVY